MLDSQAHAIAPPGVDLAHPSVTRVYDFLLGGSANWAVDREFGQCVLRDFPEMRDIAQANRMFLNRVVRHLTRLGVRQFLDIGSGVLSRANTHQFADSLDQDSRVVYADNDPVAVAHAEVLLDTEGDPDRHAVINADLSYPDHLWDEAMGTGLFRDNEPIAVLLFTVLHLLPSDVGANAVARYRELLPPGSYLGISHVTDEGIPEDLAPKVAALKRLCDTNTHSTVSCRSHAETRALLGDFELVEPGMVWTPLWHPEEETEPIALGSPSHSLVWAGVGRKPLLI